MNDAITRIYLATVAMFLVLVGFTSYWTVFDAEGLEDNAANKRPLLEEARIKRGRILARNGDVLALDKGHDRGAGRTFSRTYPYGSLYAHPVGYSFLERGRTEIERSHNGELTGDAARLDNFVDWLLGGRDQGDSIKLGLDPRAQRVAVEMLAGRHGAVVALDPSTGSVLTWAGVPSYDPNAVPDDFDELVRDDSHPLLDRVSQAGYPPGSTFKVVTAAAALESGRYSPTSVVDGSSPKEIGGATLSNAGGKSFGDITLTDALTHSVNTVWGEVGETLGAGALLQTMKRFGFGRRPPIDLPVEEVAVSGVYGGGDLLDASAPMDVGRVAIGQERLRVTPLQMAMVASAVAGGGYIVTPRLWRSTHDPDGRTVARAKSTRYSKVMSARTASALTTMMANVVREGTGTAAALDGIETAGKTGTAQVDNGASYQAWFIGFAPVESPRVAIAVTVERTSGEGGTVAAPIAKAVMEALLS